MSDKKNPEAAKQLSLKIFSVRDDARDKFIDWYITYTKEVFLLKYMLWRARKLSYLGQTFNFPMWDPREVLRHIKWLEYLLFEDIEAYAMETLMKAF